MFSKKILMSTVLIVSSIQFDSCGANQQLYDGQDAWPRRRISSLPYGQTEHFLELPHSDEAENRKPYVVINGQILRESESISFLADASEWKRGMDPNEEPSTFYTRVVQPLRNFFNSWKKIIKPASD